MQKIIQDIPKNAREVLRVELSEYKGHDLVALRLWVTNDNHQEIPTTKGINVSVSLLPAVIDALRQAEEEARSAGLLTG